MLTDSNGKPIIDDGKLSNSLLYHKKGEELNTLPVEKFTISDIENDLKKNGIDINEGTIYLDDGKGLVPVDKNQLLFPYCIPQTHF